MESDLFSSITVSFIYECGWEMGWAKSVFKLHGGCMEFYYILLCLFLYILKIIHKKVKKYKDYNIPLWYVLI